jgi:hypothetical protein
VIVLEGTKHQIIHQANYDISRDEGASRRLINDAENAPKGSVIIAAVAGDASKTLT